MPEQQGNFNSSLKIFLSVDLTGSTSLKQSSNNFNQNSKKTLPNWVYSMSLFYKGFQAAFATKWKVAQLEMNDRNVDCGHDPFLWKLAGDELIFSKDISNSYQLLWIIDAWIQAAQSFRTDLKKAVPAVDLKLSCWIAGFPIINWKVPIYKNFLAYAGNEVGVLGDPFYPDPTGSSDLDYYDYIGPSMDTGFRLGKLATPRKMSISVEVAYALSKIIDSGTVEGKTFNIHYGSRVDLKGVLGGTPYPFFWIDVSCLKEKLLYDAEGLLNSVNNNTNALSPSLIIDFCKKFIDSHEQELMALPYICSTNESILLNKAPKEHEEARTRLIQEFKTQKQLQEASYQDSEDESQQLKDVEKGMITATFLHKR